MSEELERQAFERWLKKERPATYHLTYLWDEEEDEVIRSAKASVLDMRITWMARAKQESNDG